ncbi:MAG: thiamine pyrophosphate-dependent enzyme [Candidatus Wallbacteria bacterium]|nr:thiamine pyrophosphate-dependent enzyme [Candidatus Wallbacteria bacterium]
MEKIFQKTRGLNDRIFHYCPGCGHGIAHRMVAESLEELSLLEKTVMISPVGCSVFLYWYFQTDNVQASHGRAPAVATGLKRANPGSIVVSYQGDGDLASSGTAEIIHAAARGENFTVVFINNAIYGMTGGQMAPTTLVGQKSSTSPYGRDPKFAGYPIHVCEMLATLKAPRYIERTALNNVANLNKTKKAIRKALELQEKGEGFSFVEILSPCPTNWGQSPDEAMKWLEDNMIPEYPLGVFRDAKPGEVKA